MRRLSQSRLPRTVKVLERELQDLLVVVTLQDSHLAELYRVGRFVVNQRWVNHVTVVVDEPVPNLSHYTPTLIGRTIVDAVKPLQSV